MLARKYNPGFLTDDELVASFCVRTNEFDSIIEVLRECTGRSNPHQLVIGPRGSGKTTLLLRVAVEIRRDPELSTAFYPIVFAEESYEVATTGEFWLECLSRLAVQAPKRQGEPDLNLSYGELRTVRDDRTLAERCLGALLDFADREGKRLVLVVENLNMMFKDMLDRDAGWRLRKILQTEPRIVLLASATSRFDEIDNPDEALYDLFRVSTLRRLDTNECTVLWETVSGHSRPPETIRSLEILTGGSPRLLAIVARFGADLSFRELMADLLDLVDDHTEYFKSHLEALPAQERRVYLALADLWKPATTKEIGDRARLETSKCSAQLRRLIERGAAQAVGGTARRKQYYLSERLYNIYYLLRRSRGPDNLVEALVHFMESFYSPRELSDVGARLAKEARHSSSGMSPLYQTALARLTERISTTRSGTDTTVTDVGLGHDRSDLHDNVGNEPVNQWVAESLFVQAVTLADEDREEEALEILDVLLEPLTKSEVLDSTEVVAKALIFKGTLLTELELLDEALATFDDVVLRYREFATPTAIEAVAVALVHKGMLLYELNKPEEALAAYDEVVRQFGENETPKVIETVSHALLLKSLTLCVLDRKMQAIEAFDEVSRRHGMNVVSTAIENAAIALNYKGLILITENRPVDALNAFDDAVRRIGESETPIDFEVEAISLLCKALALNAMNRLDESLIVLDDMVSRFKESKTLNDLEFTSISTLIEIAVSKGKLPGGLLSLSVDAVRQFGGNDASSFPSLIPIAMLFKGSTLLELNRIDDALATFQDAISQFGNNDAPAFIKITEIAFCEKLSIELAHERYATAIDTASCALDKQFSQPYEIRCDLHLARAKAFFLATGDPTACEPDIGATFELLTELGYPSTDTLNVLIRFSVELGPAHMRELICASPAADLLLPLTTALELELGLQPRVAVEVLEVAQDIQRDLAKLNKGEALSAGRKQIANPSRASLEQQSD